MKQKVLKFEDGTEIPVQGNLSVQLGSNEPAEEHDMDEIPKEDFDKAIDDPEHFEVDIETKEVKEKNGE